MQKCSCGDDLAPTGDKQLLYNVCAKTRLNSHPPDYAVAKFLDAWLDKSDFTDQGQDLSFLIAPERQYHKGATQVAANGDYALPMPWLLKDETANGMKADCRRKK